MIETGELRLATRGRGPVELTREIDAFVRGSGISRGVLNVFVRHTSASVLICENADPDVLRDLETWMARAVPDGDRDFVHVAEGPDDMPAHVRSVLTGSALQIPIVDARPALGTWQGVFLYEHRARPHERSVLLTALGE